MTHEILPTRFRFPIVIGLAIIALFWLSCDSAFVPDGDDGSQTMPTLPDDQAILFEVSYVNYAWSYSCLGWYVNAEGQRYSYSYQSDDEPWQPQDHQAVTEQELLDKYSHGAQFLGEIDSIEFAVAKDLIPASAIGEMTDTLSQCIDAGRFRYLAYVRDDTTLTYHPVLLYQHGDDALRNRSEPARYLFEWLRTVSGNQGRIFCPPPE